MSAKNPRNPFYFLLLIASLIFVVTALAYAIVPVLEDNAIKAGADVPNSPWRESLRKEGWRWLLVEIAAMIVFAFLSMGYDRLWTLKNEAASTTPPDEETEQPSSK